MPAKVKEVPVRTQVEEYLTLGAKVQYRNQFPEEVILVYPEGDQYRVNEVAKDGWTLVSFITDGRGRISGAFLKRPYVAAEHEDDESGAK